MKKLILLLVLGLASSVAQQANAQLNVSINIGAQPNWGPTGYNYVDYYYLPDVDSYYHVPTRKFIYYSGNRWVHHRHLPSKYKTYNLHSGRKYVINSPNPYLNHHHYKVKYSKHNDWRSNNNRHYGRGYDRQDNRKYYKSRDQHKKNSYGNRGDRRDSGRPGRG